MDLEGIQKKVFTFERKLNEECYTYGWGRGLRCAANLYEENLNLEEENDILYYKMEKYKNKYETMIDIEIKSIIDDLTNKIIHNEEESKNKYIVKILNNDTR